MLKRVYMKKIVGDLLKNRNIDESLKKYTGGFMKINNKYALIRLAMNYYTYYVSVSEDGGMVAPGFNEYVKTINETIEKYANGADDFSENISLVKEFVEKFSEIISQSLNFEFYNNLEYREEILKYLLPAVYRIKNNFFLIKTERKVEINKNIYEKIREAVIVCNSIMKEPFREDEIEYLTEISEKYIKREEEGKISLVKLMELIKKNADIYDEKKLEEEIMKAFKNKIEN